MMKVELNLDLNSKEQIRPLVTIGVPTYNRPEGLEKTISFLLKQEYDNIEIKISDNCSTNIRVKEILEKYALEDKRVTYTIQKTNIQIEPNFNYVYTGATGKYFMWLADDDSFENDYISSCVDFLEKNTDYLLCSGGCKYLKGGNVSYLEIDKSLESNSPLKRMFRYLYYVNKNGLFYGVYRNNIKFVKPIEKHIGADWCHLARIALLGKVKVLDHIVNVRSDEGGNSSRKKMTANFGLFKTLFFETYVSYEVSKNLFNEPICRSKINKAFSFLIQIVVFLFLNIKFLWNSIRRRFKTIPSKIVNS